MIGISSTLTALPQKSLAGIANHEAKPQAAAPESKGVSADHVEVKTGLMPTLRGATAGGLLAGAAAAGLFALAGEKDVRTIGIAAAAVVGAFSGALSANSSTSKAFGAGSGVVSGFLAGGAMVGFFGGLPGAVLGGAGGAAFGSLGGLAGSLVAQGK